MTNLPENIVFLWYVRVLCANALMLQAKSGGVR